MKFALLALLLSSPAFAAGGKDVQARMEKDAAAGKPLLAHVIVSLADNKHQGIVPVAPKLGKETGAHAPGLTTGMMCPQAYTLDSMLKAWFSGADARAAREAVARAYRKYQKCSQKAARGLFSGDD
jgi:hypothetical protein